MSRTLLSLAGFQVIISGRFWVIAEGCKRGQTVKVCADPNCHVHHPNTPSPLRVAKERAEEPKRFEKEKLAITVRHRVLSTILQRVSVPLKKANLATIAHYLKSSGTLQILRVQNEPMFQQ